MRLPGRKTGLRMFGFFDIRASSEAVCRGSARTSRKQVL